MLLNFLCTHRLFQVSIPREAYLLAPFGKLCVCVFICACACMLAHVCYNMEVRTTLGAGPSSSTFFEARSLAVHSVSITLVQSIQESSVFISHLAVEVMGLQVCATLPSSVDLNSGPWAHTASHHSRTIIGL